MNVAAAVSDLKVTAATTHATAKAGKRSTVAVHLQDVGTGAVSGTVTITVTATPVDGLGPAVVVATVPRPVHLYAGRRATASVAVQLPTLPAGRYQFAVAVSPVTAGDVDATDKSATTAVTLVSAVAAKTFRG